MSDKQADTARQIVDELAACGVKLVASLPDNWLTGVINTIEQDDRFVHVPVNREESAIGLCSGAYMGAMGSAALMGASGFMTVVYAITTACQRGLEVQLFVSEIGDQGLVYHAQRSYYDALLEAGVKIFLYPAPFILHSKHFSIDDNIAVIGSSNMDIRSFSLNMEVSLLVLGESFVAGMREVEQGYRDAGRQLTLEEWKREPGKATFLDGIARLTSAVN